MRRGDSSTPAVLPGKLWVHITSCLPLQALMHAVPFVFSCRVLPLDPWISITHDVIAVILSLFHV